MKGEYRHETTCSAGACPQAVCDQSAVPPLIFHLPPEQGREVLERAQDLPVSLYPADIFSEMIDIGAWGRIPVYFVLPKNEAVTRVLFYIHGAGWVFGSFHTHEKLVRELCARTGSLVVFPEYSRSPEAKYPTALEQCDFLLSHLQQILARRYPDVRARPLAVAGDSVGGNVAIAEALLAKRRGGRTCAASAAFVLSGDKRLL